MAPPPRDLRSSPERRLRSIIFILRPSMARRVGVANDRIDDLTENGRLAWRIALEQVAGEGAGLTSAWAAAALEVECVHRLDERSVLNALSTDLAVLQALTPAQGRAWARNLDVAFESLVRSGRPLRRESPALVAGLLASTARREPLVAAQLERFVRHAGRVGVRPSTPAATAMDEIDEAGLRRIIGDTSTR